MQEKCSFGNSQLVSGQNIIKTWKVRVLSHITEGMGELDCFRANFELLLHFCLPMTVSE